MTKNNMEFKNKYDLLEKLLDVTRNLLNNRTYYAEELLHQIYNELKDYNEENLEDSIKNVLERESKKKAFTIYYKIKGKSLNGVIDFHWSLQPNALVPPFESVEVFSHSEFVELLEKYGTIEPSIKHYIMENDKNE